MQITKVDIHEIFSVKGGTYVMIQYLSGTYNFTINESSQINGIRLDCYLEIPRKVDLKGRQIYNFYIVKLANLNDGQHLAGHTTAELVTIV